MKSIRRIKRVGPDDADSLVLGVVRGIVEPHPEGGRGAYIFGVDTRNYGRGRLISHLPELDELDTYDLPSEAVITPRLYVVAGPSDRIPPLAQRAGRRLRAFSEELGQRSPSEVRMRLQRDLAGVGNRFSFDTLLDLFCSELVAGEPRFPHLGASKLGSQSAVLCLYSSERPEGAPDINAFNAVVEGWFNTQVRPGVDRPLTERDVLEMVNNPIYGYGLVLEPMGDLVEAVDDFVHALADRPGELTVQSLDREFQALFARLERSGRFRRRLDAPPIVSKELWLGAQLARIQHIRAGEPE